MAKSTVEQKIRKVEEAILKEELLIEESKKKIKSLQKNLRALKEEQEQQYASEIMKHISAKGISKAEFLAKLKSEERSENSSFPDDEKSQALSSSSPVPNSSHGNEKI